MIPADDSDRTISNREYFSSKSHLLILHPAKSQLNLFEAVSVAQNGCHDIVQYQVYTFLYLEFCLFAVLVHVCGKHRNLKHRRSG